VKWICSKEEFVLKHLQNLKKKLLERGYPCELVEANLCRGPAIPRADLLRPTPVYPQQDCPALLSKPRFTPMFIITYNPHNHKLHQWIKDNHNILLADKKMSKIFPTPPSVSYRQARNIKQLMVRSRLKALPHSDCSDLKPAGCFKHQHGIRGRNWDLCHCPRIKEGNTFRSSYTGKSYNIRHNLTCKSKYCV
jgi:hypothetical protein